MTANNDSRSEHDIIYDAPGSQTALPRVDDLKNERQSRGMSIGCDRGTIPNTAPAADSAPSMAFVEQSRMSTSGCEQLLIDALRSTHWKVTTAESRIETVSSNQLASGTAVEIERRLRRTGTPATVAIREGKIKPVSGLEEELSESPLVQAGEVKMPGWASSDTEHHWVEVDFAGTPHEFLVDAAAPPQFTGRPHQIPKVIPIGSGHYRPTQYVPDGPPERLSAVDVDTPWPVTVHSDPFGRTAGPSLRPTDGGTSVSPDANKVIHMDARDGLRELPDDSVDVVITSPPYRLLRKYPDAERIWGGDLDCDHTWETEDLYTDTPIRTDGCAGFGGDGAEKTRKERHRDSVTCTDCGAWHGQLGLEPTLGEFIDHLMEIFDEIKRVLQSQGSLWVNIGDSYANGHKTPEGEYRDAPLKSLRGVPPKFELAMRERGWIVRERNIWAKTNVVPDPYAQKRTPAHEHIFRFVLDPYYDDTDVDPGTSVLKAATASKETSHTAVMPEKIPVEIIRTTLDQSEPAVVLDPFAGSGTVLKAAAQFGHRSLGFEVDGEIVEEANSELKQYANPGLDSDQTTVSGQAGLSDYIT